VRSIEARPQAVGVGYGDKTGAAAWSSTPNPSKIRVKSREGWRTPRPAAAAMRSPPSPRAPFALFHTKRGERAGVRGGSSILNPLRPARSLSTTVCGWA
jgi:hypothetical protein